MKLPVYSYTFLNTYDICPKQAFHRYVLKDHPFVGSTESKWGNVVHSAMKSRLRDKTPLPKEVAKYEPFAAAIEPFTISVEEKLGVTKDGSLCGFFDDNVWLRGMADVVAAVETSAMLPDWKTGKKREDPYELEIQGVLVQAKWPQFERITGHYVWLQDGVVGRAHDVSNTGETLECLQEKADEIEHCHKTGEWRTKSGPLCGWCPVLSCNFNRLKK